MLGSIIGDISGSIYEYNNVKTKDINLMEGMCFFTDDTIMTAAIAESLLEVGDNWSEDALSGSFIKNLDKFGKRYPYGDYGGGFRNWLDSVDKKPYNSFGNGSAMRVSSVGWFAKSLEEAIEIAQISAKITHSHEEGIKGAVVTAGAVYLAKAKHSKEEIKEFIEKYYDISFTLEEIRESYYYDVTCQGTVPQAMVAFLESESFEDSIKNGISIGGDTDTLCAITGAVAEAYYGISPEMRNYAYLYLTEDILKIVKDFTEKYVKE